MSEKYKVVSLSGKSTSARVEMLEEMSANKWDLVTIDGGFAYFKRPEKENYRKTPRKDPRRKRGHNGGTTPPRGTRGPQGTGNGGRHYGNSH